VFNFASGFVAAVVAGWAALKIGRSPLAVKILAGLILVVGVYYGLTTEASYADRQPVDKPVDEMSFMEAGQHAKQPAWYKWTIPLVGLAGVLLGGRRRSES